MSLKQELTQLNATVTSEMALLTFLLSDEPLKLTFLMTKTLRIQIF